eukprot:TRINITY_DN13066_c0_g1_i1.p1 TRINITY_DN13066_c0_g1~~TRINITY_DN13066_c0_g1_i1.p1  ORF type:complete len:341 (-),score=26.95 TRINITY_DN13066_c0_g1_i1:194-1174(-)
MAVTAFPSLRVICSDQVQKRGQLSPNLDIYDEDFCREKDYRLYARLPGGCHHVGCCLRTGRHVFVKARRLESEEDCIPARCVREIRVLKECHHPNIVKLYDVHQSPCRLRMLLELLDLNLTEYLATRGAFQGAALASATHQCFAGLDYCHNHGILHRQLQPLHVLVELSTMRLVLAGFGLTRPFSVPLYTDSDAVQHLWYLSPEMLLGQPMHGPAIDIWAMGCIFAEMATTVPVFPGESEIGTLLMIFKSLGTPTDAEWPGVTSLPHYNPEFPKWGAVQPGVLPSVLGPEGVDLLASCLRYDFTERLTARGALRHAFHGISADCGA